MVKLSGPMTGSTSSVTPVLRFSNAVGVVGVTGNDGAAEDSHHGHRHAAARRTDGLRDLWGLELRRVNQLADDLDGRLLATLGGHARGAEQIDALLLVKRADDDLELRVAEHARRC